ncbi:outer membrane beta-barrel protein [Spirosoma spitsbergense]|uniref:outer membrane beta-barrel protein n=1 Tax=Spirosoma spitsbergense TaxID=431554 RepID=UPI000361574E|nr:outer membrane beta-barrel protein [Spirosoma spitsbergense]
MRKHILFILSISLLTAFSTTAHAQTRPRQTTTKPAPKPPTPKPDLLVRQDGTQLEVLVTEITDREIVYKRFNNPSGPLFRSQKADFSFLKYGSNDEIEQFTKVVQPTPPQPGPAPVQPTQTRSTSYAPAPVYQPRQSSSSKKTRFGLLAGGQSAIISFDGSTEGTKSIFGFRGGLLFDRSFSSAVSLRTQFLYSSKGASSISSNRSLNVNYLEIPFDFLYKIETSGAQFLLGGGGYFGTLLNAKFGPNDAAKLFTKQDAGVRVSGWVDFSSGLTLNAFYNVGLLDINSGLSSRERWKNQTFGVGIGYFLSRK